MHTWIYHLHRLLMVLVICQAPNNRPDSYVNRWLVGKSVHLLYVVVGTRWILFCCLLAAQSDSYKSFFRTTKCHLGLSSFARGQSPTATPDIYNFQVFNCSPEFPAQRAAIELQMYIPSPGFPVVSSSHCT
jgi:hypothetical protein